MLPNRMERRRQEVPRSNPLDLVVSVAGIIPPQHPGLLRAGKATWTAPCTCLSLLSTAGQVRSGSPMHESAAHSGRRPGQNKKRGTCFLHRPHIATHMHKHVYRVRGRHIFTNCMKSSMRCIQAKEFLAVSFQVPKPRQRQYALSLSSRDCCNA